MCNHQEFCHLFASVFQDDCRPQRFKTPHIRLWWVSTGLGKNVALFGLRFLASSFEATAMIHVYRPIQGTYGCWRWRWRLVPTSDVIVQMSKMEWHC